MKTGTRDRRGAARSLCARRVLGGVRTGGGGRLGPVQSTTTTPEPPPTTEPPPTSPPPETTPPSRQLGIPGGVSIAHVDVGGLLPYQAADVMRKAFARPLVLATPTGSKVRAPRRRSAPSPRSGKPSAAPASRGREPSSRCTSGSPVSGFGGCREPGPRARQGTRQLARLILRGTTVRATRSVDGRRLERLVGARADPRRAEDRRPFTDPALVRGAEAAGRGTSSVRRS